jgi:hypothetical protein
VARSVAQSRDGSALSRRSRAADDQLELAEKLFSADGLVLKTRAVMLLFQIQIGFES